MLPYVLPVGPQKPSSSDGQLAIDWKAGAGDRAGAERIAVGPVVGALQPRGVAFQLLDHAEQVVRDGRRLRALRVGVDGEYGFAMRVDQVEQRPAQLEGGGNQSRG